MKQKPFTGPLRQPIPRNTPAAEVERLRTERLKVLCDRYALPHAEAGSLLARKMAEEMIPGFSSHNAGRPARTSRSERERLFFEVFVAMSEKGESLSQAATRIRRHKPVSDWGYEKETVENKYRAFERSLMGALPDSPFRLVACISKKRREKGRRQSAS